MGWKSDWADGWQELKNQFVGFVVDFFEHRQSDMLADLWDIAVPIVEEISGLDVNDDAVVHHMKVEIMEIATDKAIEWGDELTDAMVEGASGGFLKQLFAAARVAEWLAKIKYLVAIPAGLRGWIINLVIEWAMKGIKAGLQQAQLGLHDEVEKSKREYTLSLGALLIALEKAGVTRHIEVNHSWGMNTFKLLVQDVNEANEPAFRVYTGSLRQLTCALAEDGETWPEYVDYWKNRIELNLGLIATEVV